jgi:hypothetical protein
VHLGPGHAVLLYGSSLGTDLGTTPTVEDDELDPLLPTIINRIGYEPGRDDHVNDIDIGWDIRDRRVSLESSYLIRLGINGIDGTFVPIVQ